MDLTLTDLRTVLAGQRRAEEVIFWFCLAWHSGKDSTLYRILREVNFTPRRHSQAQIANDPEIVYGLGLLDDYLARGLGHPLSEAPLNFVKFADVRENDVLIHGKPRGELLPGLVSVFPCIDTGWPCRVYTWKGDLGVACAEGPSGASFHALTMTRDGYVEGFMR